MKKSVLLFSAIISFVLFFHLPAFAWQGRTAGMGDSAGLVDDESDYLTHPALIASLKSLSIYGTCAMSFEKTVHWDNTTALPLLNYDYPYKAEGHEWKAKGQAGFSLPLWKGGFGLFFGYSGNGSDYSGKENDCGTSTDDHKFYVKSKVNDFILSVIYGIPVRSLKTGFELLLMRGNEENLGKFDDSFIKAQNIFYAAYNAPALDLLAYKIPYISDYFKSAGKISFNVKTGSVMNNLTFYGGIILPFVNDNKFDYEDKGLADKLVMEGEISGWDLAADYWMRYVKSKSISFPFVMGIAYGTTLREGSGLGNYSAVRGSYKHDSDRGSAVIGGGPDFNFNKNTKIAFGIYYNYFYSKDKINFKDPAGASRVHDYPEYPQSDESRISLKASAEKNISSGFVLRGGLYGFYGKVKNKYSSRTYENSILQWDTEMETDGNSFGAGLSLGTTLKTGKVNIEPYLNGGFSRLKTDGDGKLFGAADITGDSKRLDWVIGGGLSVKY
jgi:hypothetical protein